MPERDRNLLGRLAPRGSRKPTERDWQRSTLLEPRLSTYEPELISDGFRQADSGSGQKTLSAVHDPTIAC